MANREMAKARMREAWTELVACGEWSEDQMVDSLHDQIDGYCDMACEELTDEMAVLMGWDIDDLSDDQLDEWESIVNEACTEWLNERGE